MGLKKTMRVENLEENVGLIRFMQKTVVISVNYGFGGSVMTVTNAKSSAESEKFTLKI